MIRDLKENIDGIYEYVESLHARLKEVERTLQIYKMVAASAYATQRFGRRGGKYLLNCIKPKTFNEKLIWLRENYWERNPITYYNTDKYFFKYYTEKLWGKEHSIPLLGVWDRARDIDFDSLPEKFVLKRTLSGGSFEVKIVDKRKNDLEVVRKIAGSWVGNQERVKARIIAERLLESDKDGYVYDYKLFVINGIPRFFLVARAHEDGRPRTTAYYDMEWKRIPVKDYHSLIDIEVKKPELFNEMVEFAQEIGRHFPLVRVDMYTEKGNFFLGELTDVSNTGLCQLNPVKYDTLWGRMIKLPSEKEIQENFSMWYSLFPELKENPIFLRSNMDTYTIEQPNKPDNSLPLPPLPFIQPSRKI